MDAIFQESLSVPWGVLGLLTFENKPWFYVDEGRFEPFLEAAIHVWDELDAVGPRYFDGVQGQPLWRLTGSLHYVLANMGVPQDLLRAPLPPRRATLLAQVRTHRELRPLLASKAGGGGGGGASGLVRARGLPATVALAPAVIDL